MIYESWQPTMFLRWTAAGLEQKWWRRTIDYRQIAGKERRCEGAEGEWRLVPTESSSEKASDEPG